MNAVGDVNGDGFADLGIGVANGQGYLLFGREDFGRERELRLANEIATGRAAWFQLHEDAVSTLRYLAMAPLGDITGDEVDDFAAGLSISAGELALVAGRREWPAKQWGLEDQILATVIGDREDQHLADEVRYLGDVDGDEVGPQLPVRIDLANLGGLGVKFDGVNLPGGAGAATGPWGDLNGDGQPDFAFSEWVTTEGRAHVYIIYGPYLDRPFVRGDANRDGRVDVSDPVFVLRHLFSGDEGSRCDDAADVDDRGQIDLTDAVGLLNYLFAGTVPPAPPHPEAGLDPTPDGLGCLGF